MPVAESRYMTSLFLKYSMKPLTKLLPLPVNLPFAHRRTTTTGQKLSPDAKRRIQKLRCGWLPVNRRVAREDPNRDEGCKAWSPGNLVEETVDHILQCEHQPRRDALRDRFAGMP
jgi:hypothetical protein